MVLVSRHLSEGKSSQGRVFSAHQEFRETQGRMSTSFSPTGRRKTIGSPASSADGGSVSCLPLQPPACCRGVAGLTSRSAVSGQRQAGELCAGRACFIPLGWDCHNYCFLDLQVLTALSVPPI